MSQLNPKAESTGKSGWVERLKERASNAVNFKGYVFYFFSSFAKGETGEKDNTKVNLGSPSDCKMIPLPALNPVLRIRQSGEVFTLNSPAFHIEGKPVWLVLRGFPHSLKISFLENHFVERGYSTDEIDAKNYSIYVNRVFRQSSMNINYVYLLISLIVIAVMICLFASSAYYQSIIDGLKAEMYGNALNLTGGLFH